MKRKRGLHREDHAPAHRAGGTSGAATAPPRHSGRRILGVAALAVGLLGGAVLADWYWALPDSVTATYVGSQACAECHQSQYRSWLSSHHFYAMQPATEETVLGDFNDAELHYHGIVARMYKRDGQFWVRTEGPDGQLHDYPVKYTFGVEPLQQYLVEFEGPEDAGPNTVGRLQVLRECWDTRQKRWFYLPPPDVPEKLDPSDDLHWTGIGQRWNTMCAECHSTDVHKNFDPSTGRYRTTFSEISVGCEACHGPGSVHIQLAKAYSLFWDRKRGYGLARLKGDNPDPQIETCAYCHSRRRVLDESQGAGQSFFNRCALELPSAQTYFADGQILDEVYEVGSFWQSRMYHQKIRCSDCHDPHTARLKHSGNAVCTSCHQHPAGRYDTPSHHHHRPGSPGAQCVNCHMPETVYMEVDGRRDHSLRVPRPDLSVRLGVPNACTACHLERVQVEPQKRAELGQYRDWVIAARRDLQLRQALQLVDQWAAQSVEQWYGDSPARRMRHYGEYLASAWENAPSAVPHVLELCRSKHYPAVIRAAGWAWLVSVADRQALDHARDALHDPHPLVRAAAVTLWEPFLPSPDDVRMLDASQRQALAEYVGQQFAPLWPMLSDPAKAVRTQAASILGRIPATLLVLVTDGQQRWQLQQAAEEWIHTLHVHNDRAGSHVALGVYYEAQGDDQRAEQAYRTALRVEPNTVGPRSNLAALLERRLHGLQQQWQQTLIARNQAQAQFLAGQMADLQQQVTELRSQELELLARDARLAPDNPDVLYRYGLALYLNGRADEAAQVLERGAQLERRTSRFPLALALLYEKLQQWSKAMEHARRLLELDPNNPEHQRLIQNFAEKADAAGAGSPAPSEP